MVCEEFWFLNEPSSFLRADRKMVSSPPLPIGVPKTSFRRLALFGRQGPRLVGERILFLARGQARAMRRFYEKRSNGSVTTDGRARGWTIRGFLDNAKGAIAVEFAAVFPVFMLLVAGVVEFGMIFMAQTQMGHVARDTARRLAVGEIATQQAAIDYANGNLLQFSSNYTIAVTIPDPSDPAETDFVVTIATPASDIAVLGLVDGLLAADVVASATMKEE